MNPSLLFYAAPPENMRSYRNVNFPMFRKLQCGSNPPLTIHVVSFCGNVPLTMLYNSLDSTLSFTETLCSHTFVTQAYFSRKEGKSNGVAEEYLKKIHGQTLITSYRPAFKKNEEFHRTNYAFYPVDNGDARHQFFEILNSLLYQSLEDEVKGEKTGIHALLYIMPCHICYKRSSEEEMCQKTFFWNIVNKLEEAARRQAKEIKLPMFIVVDHLNSNFNWTTQFVNTAIQTATNKVNRDEFSNSTHGIVCPIFGIKEQNEETNNFLEFYQLEPYVDVLFSDVSVQFGFRIETVLALVQETLFKE